MDGLKYTENDVVKALDEAYSLIIDSVRDVFTTSYDKEIALGTVKEYKRAVELLLLVGENNDHRSD